MLSWLLYKYKWPRHSVPDPGVSSTHSPSLPAPPECEHHLNQQLKVSMKIMCSNGCYCLNIQNPTLKKTQLCWTSKNAIQTGKVAGQPFQQHRLTISLFNFIVEMNIAVFIYYKLTNNQEFRMPEYNVLK